MVPSPAPSRLTFLTDPVLPMVHTLFTLPRFSGDEPGPPGDEEQFLETKRAEEDAAAAAAAAAWSLYYGQYESLYGVPAWGGGS